MATRVRNRSHRRSLRSYIHCLSVLAILSGACAALNILGAVLSAITSVVARRALETRRREDRLNMLAFAYFTCIAGVIIYGVFILAISFLPVPDNCTHLLALNEFSWFSTWLLPPLVFTQYISGMVLAMLTMVLDLALEDELCDSASVRGTESRGQSTTTETPVGHPAWYTPRGSATNNHRDPVMGIPVTV